MNTETKLEVAENKPEPPAYITLCGRALHSDPQFFPRVEYHGRTIYFCTSVCMDAFLADPERIYSTHRRSHDQKEPK